MLPMCCIQENKDRDDTSGALLRLRRFCSVPMYCIQENKDRNSKSRGSETKLVACRCTASRKTRIENFSTNIQGEFIDQPMCCIHALIVKQASPFALAPPSSNRTTLRLADEPSRRGHVSH